MNITKISFFLFFTVLVAGCESGNEPSTLAEDDRSPVTVTTETVGEGDLTDSYEAIGTIRSKTSSVVSSKVVGHVVMVQFNEGDRVRKGQRLVTIDDRDAKNRLAMAQAGLVEVESAKEEVERAILAGKSAHDAAKANANLTESTLKRFEELLKRQSVSQQEFDEIQTRSTAANAEVNRASEMLGAVEAKRTQVEAKITQAKVNLESANLYSSYFRIVAPFSGIVTHKSVEVGQLASPGVPLLTIDDPGSYRLEALVEESKLRSISPGDPVPVLIDAIEDRIDGTVDEILPVADPASRSVTVRISLTGTEGLKSGMFGKARFPGGVRRVLTVSNSSLVRRGQLVGLFVVDESSRARFRLIKPGRMVGDRTEVLAGLKNGEKVVLNPDHEVTDGRQVRNQNSYNSNPIMHSGVNS